MASTAGGTLGLVNDLSVKLQKQRKQLNTLVKEVKSAQAAELRWASSPTFPPIATAHPYTPPRPAPCTLHTRAVW